MNCGTVTPVGYSDQGNLKKDAEMAAKRSSGVDELANEIEVLPASMNDDRIRWETFYRIYTDDFLSRYAPGDSAADRQIVEVRAREVSGVFSVENDLIVAGKGRDQGAR